MYGMTWTYDHDYHECDEELDYAYCETDTWDWWRFWLPIVLLALLVAAYYAEEYYTRPPKPTTAVTYEYADSKLNQWVVVSESNRWAEWNEFGSTVYVQHCKQVGENLVCRGEQDGGRLVSGGNEVVNPDPVLNWRGKWEKETPYRRNDVVTEDGNFYVAMRPNLKQKPPKWPIQENEFWITMAGER